LYHSRAVDGGRCAVRILAGFVSGVKTRQAGSLPQFAFNASNDTVTRSIPPWRCLACPDAAVRGLLCRGCNRSAGAGELWFGRRDWTRCHYRVACGGGDNGAYETWRLCGTALLRLPAPHSWCGCSLYSGLVPYPRASLRDTTTAPTPAFQRKAATSMAGLLQRTRRRYVHCACFALLRYISPLHARLRQRQWRITAAAGGLIICCAALAQKLA